MSDPLKDFEFEQTGTGLYLKLAKGSSVKLRVLTTDPLVSIDKWDNTRYNFVVWNWDEGKAQILSKGASIARPIRNIHIDPDYGANIQEIDVKITATSTGPEDKDVEYAVNPLPKAQPITKEILEQVKAINLEDEIPGGKRLSDVIKGEHPEKPAEEESATTKAREVLGGEEVVLTGDEPDFDKPVDLSDIPF